MVGGPLSPDNGSVKAGSYIVRHAIKGNAVTPVQGNRIAEGTPTVVAGSKGWLDLRFPVIQEIDSTTNTIKLNNVPGYLHTSGSMRPACGTTGELFVILKSQYTTYDSTLGAGTAIHFDSRFGLPNRLFRWVLRCGHGNPNCELGRCFRSGCGGGRVLLRLPSMLRLPWGSSAAIPMPGFPCCITSWVRGSRKTM